MSIRINGLVQYTHDLNQQVFNYLIKQKDTLAPVPDKAFHTKILNGVIRTKSKVEKICGQHNASPADLPNPSFRAYQWVRFLSDPNWLDAHLCAYQDFINELRAAYDHRLLTPLPDKITLRVTHGTYLYRSRKNRTTHAIEIHEGFILAPQEVKKAIIQSSIKGTTSEKTRIIKKYTQHPDYKKVLSVLNENGQKNHHSSKGHFHDLEKIYKELNQAYFNGRLSQPRLVWSSRLAVRRLGSYDAESGTICISRRLDQPDIDRLLVAYVLYHEMLHQSLGIQVVNGRRHAHTTQFKNAEKSFTNYRQAQELIKKLK